MICLKEKLKGVVNNNSLKKFGVLNIYHKNGTGISKLTLSASSVRTIEIVGNGHFTDSTGVQNLGTSASIGTNRQDLYVSDGDFHIEVPDKYSITVLAIPNNNISLGIDIEDLAYCDSINNYSSFIPRTITKGDVSNLAFPNVTTINTYLNDGVYGDFKKWVESLNGGCTSLTLNGNGNAYFSGNINLLVQNTGLTDIKLNHGSIIGDFGMLGSLTNLAVISILNPELLTGTIESFVENARNAGKTTGNVRIGACQKMNITFSGFTGHEGVATPIKDVITTASATLSWTADSISLVS